MGTSVLMMSATAKNPVVIGPPLWKNIRSSCSSPLLGASEKERVPVFACPRACSRSPVWRSWPAGGGHESKLW